MSKLFELLAALIGRFFSSKESESEPEAAPETNGVGMSADGLQVLKYYESCRLEAYWDANGKVWTIGWGDTGPDVVKGLRITQAEADLRLKNRLANEFVPGVLSTLTRSVTKGQLDAMVDLAYNIGVSAFRGSTLLRKFNAGDTAGAAAEFKRWNKSKGKVLLGLTRRRASDEALFNGKLAQEAIRIGAAIND